MSKAYGSIQQMFMNSHFYLTFLLSTRILIPLHAECCIRHVSATRLISSSLKPVNPSCKLFAKRKIKLLLHIINDQKCPLDLYVLWFCRLCPLLQKNFWANVIYLKHALQKYNINICKNESHIISVPIPTVHKVKAVAKELLNNYQFYVQPIFYPTVPIGKEMLRLTVSPYHTNKQIENLAKALKAALQ